MENVSHCPIIFVQGLLLLREIEKSFFEEVTFGGATWLDAQRLYSTELNQTTSVFINASVAKMPDMVAGAKSHKVGSLHFYCNVSLARTNVICPRRL